MDPRHPLNYEIPSAPSLHSWKFTLALLLTVILLALAFILLGFLMLILLFFFR